jgi:hypothetical protein
MASNPLPTAFFGTGFSQDLEKITILKTDLQPPIGLTPKLGYDFTPEADNRAETLFSAIFLRVQRNQDISADSQLVITPFEKELTFRFGRWQRRYYCTVEIYIDDSASEVPNPNLI